MIKILFNFLLFLRSVLRKLLPASLRAPQPGETTLSTAWVSRTLKQTGVLSENEILVRATIQGNATGGLTNLVQQVECEISKQGKTRTLPLILKRSNVASRTDVIDSQRYREAIFYTSDIQRQCMPSPRCFYAGYSKFFGEYVCLCEDLKQTYNATLAAYSFGDQTRAPEKAVTVEEQLQLLENIFTVAAKQHAAFWNNNELLRTNWLKGTQWRRGESGESWTFLLNKTKRLWDNVSRAKMVSSSWCTERLIKLIDSTFENASFERFQQRCRTSPFALVHGDFHSMNMFAAANGNEGVFAVDWSEIGVGDPAVEIAQMLISDVRLEIFKENGMKLLRFYHSKLGIEDYSFEQCYDSFARGGAERWFVFLVLLASFLDGDRMKYFHDQVLAFVDTFPPKDSNNGYLYTITSIY